jgi:hypothetical protein
LSTNTEHILSKYHLLIPKIEYASIIITLVKKTNEGENEYFSFEDIEYVARKANPKVNINIETAVQYLLNFFLIKAPNHTNTYTLTQYARNFVNVISDKISSPYSNLPLRQNFEKYFKLRDEDLSSVENLNSWFNLGFDLVSKKVVSEHVESLYDSLKEATIKLNEILLLESVTALELVKRFRETFQKFVEKSREIREVINFKNEVLRKIDNFENELHQLYDSFSANERTSQRIEFENAKRDWKEVKAIGTAVKTFFNQLDQRFENINAQIHFASEKLNELGETFEKKALLKVNLKKMLRCALLDTIQTNEGIKFNSFPLKALPYQRIYLNGFKKYDFEVEPQNPIIIQEEDKEYFKEQESEFLKDVNTQERISVWIDNLKQRLEAEKQLDLTTEFQKMYNEENNSQTPLRVCYDLINKSQSNINDEIEIIPELDTHENKIELWKILIKRK